MDLCFYFCSFTLNAKAWHSESFSFVIYLNIAFLNSFLFYINLIANLFICLGNYVGIFFSDIGLNL